MRPDSTIVGAWCRHAAVRAVSFTGSTEVGRLVAAQCAPGIKRLIMELGGHAPFIVFPDADLDRAVDSAMAAKYATSGQDCLAVNRFMVHEDVHDAFISRFAERSAAEAPEKSEESEEGGDGGGAAGNQFGVPEHLLERSKAARQRLAA